MLNSIKSIYWDYERRLKTNNECKRLGLQFTSKSDVNEVIYKKIYTQFFDFLPDKDSVIIDVGSQYGDYSILCEKIYNAKEIYAFEALDDTYYESIKNYKLNNCKIGIMRNIVLGDGKNIIGFVKKDMFTVLTDIKDKKSKVNFFTSKLDDFKLKPTLMKIDVEGNEYAVLKGAEQTIREYKPKIIIELHTLELEKICLKFLKNLGYIVKHISDVRLGYNEQKVGNFFLEYEGIK